MAVFVPDIPQAMKDSVFDPLITYASDVPNAGDRPMPVRTILRAFERIERAGVELMVDALNAQIDGLIDRATPALERGDLGAIASLEWSLSPDLQRSIYSVWSMGWSVGGDHAVREMIASVPVELRGEAEDNEQRLRFGDRNPLCQVWNLGRQRLGFATADNILIQILRLLTLGAVDLSGNAAERAVQDRVFRLAGDFSADTLRALQSHLTAAVIGEGDAPPIPRAELRRRIERTLEVGSRRATAIARTELTNAYNTGRVVTMQQSGLVTHLRFLAIGDDRTTDICRSRNGMVIPITDQSAVQANTPALHVNCRSTVSPLLPEINPRHREMVEDPGRDYLRRSLAPLPRGWN